MKARVQVKHEGVVGYISDLFFPQVQEAVNYTINTYMIQTIYIYNK